MFGDQVISPINLAALKESLNNYPKKDIAGQLFEGFSSGFKINYHGPRLPVETNNFKSVLENPQIALEKFENEIQLGRIAGPFQYSPISNLRCSPIGVIPKKDFRLAIDNTFVLPDFWQC